MYFMRNIILLLSDILFGTTIYKCYLKIREEEKLSRLDILKLQQQKLESTLKNAILNVPYYNSLRNELNELDSYKLLSKFPIISKKIISPDISQFVSSKANITKLTKLFSGGSSGNPGLVYVNKNNHSMMRARVLRLWENAGYQFGNPILQLGFGSQRSFLKKLKDLSMNVQYELAFEINEEKVLAVLKKVKSKTDICFVGYASGLYEYARIAEKHQLGLKFKLVISLGDKMFDHYRQKIETVFNTSVFDTYGSNEGFVIGGQHADGNYYLNETHCYIEIVDDQYYPVPRGESGRLLVTCLDNHAMPLIRFDIGDILSINDYNNETPLKVMTIKSIIGRDLDIIKTRSGQSLIVHFFTAILSKFLELEQFRVVQNSIEEIEIEYIPSHHFRQEVLENIREIIYKRLPPNELVVLFKKVSSIPNSPSGKPQILVSKLEKK
jgi:phenylacetate-CoA ligase